jgi:hypothetical protein
MRREESRVALCKQRQRVPPEPAHDLVGRKVERLRRRADESEELRVGIAAERRIRAVEPGRAEQLVPCVLAILARDDCLEEIEDDSLHGYERSLTDAHTSFKRASRSQRMCGKSG